ncbi:acyl transferase/acyl hydrolase/lysophospholipase [Exophiala viscosa]|uniref:acyl transferase/acyl hydrolase/lysophospholipase n=1 Tax=Exophiala viscosa TaxID=2486360 RepID=UPI00219C8AB4|nr:acyl transferase/acyl hydrolase/lysophospholipase [Exophiala viscosa]
MAVLSNIFGLFWGLMRCFLLMIWVDPWTKPPPVREGKSIITYEQWYAAQYEKDAIRGVDDWVVSPRDSSYDWQIVKSLKKDLERCRLLGDDRGLCSQLRAQSSRNMGRILSPSLYRKSNVQTKRLIHDYIKEVRLCIAHISDRNHIANNVNTLVSAQEKRQVLQDMRTALGRTTLVLQGGAMISMCHLGVVKALYLQRLLPQIITGTGTGALIAALVSTTPDENLLAVVNGSNINLDAFHRAQHEYTNGEMNSWSGSLKRRYKRYRASHHLFDIDVLRDCARDNLGDITFEEAYAKTGRILNITIAMSEVAGTPQLLNYITAPHVLIWSAVASSIATSKEMYAPVQLLCKGDTGAITLHFAADFSGRGGLRQASVHPEAPLTRIGELFNVNHFIVSQTRPYVAPFVQLQKFADRYQPLGILVRLCLNELLHWLEILNGFGFVPTILQRVLVDEIVPSFASWSKISITPGIGLHDLLTMFDTPTRSMLQKWSARGERCTWPSICELQCRCDIELELEAAYASIRRRTVVPSISIT